LLLVFFSAGVSGGGALFSGWGAAGITGGTLTSGFGVSAARMILSVMEMTFHVRPKEISRQKAVIARAGCAIEAALRLRKFNRSGQSYLRSLGLLSRAMSGNNSAGPNGIGNDFKCTAIWSTSAGFHRFHASGYLSAKDAKEAARAGANSAGYVRPSFFAYLLRGGLVFES
jgi:hypothetical protein